jgi:hypothetical protein
LRIDQETGAQIVLFRRGFSHFDSARPQMVWPFARLRGEHTFGTSTWQPRVTALGISAKTGESF